MQQFRLYAGDFPKPASLVRKCITMLGLLHLHISSSNMMDTHQCPSSNQGTLLVRNIPTQKKTCSINKNAEKPTEYMYVVLHSLTMNAEDYY